MISPWRYYRSNVGNDWTVSWIHLSLFWYLYSNLLVIGLLLCDLVIFSTGYIKNLMGCNGNEHCVGVGTRVNDPMDLAETDARAQAARLAVTLLMKLEAVWGDQLLQDGLVERWVWRRRSLLYLPEDRSLIIEVGQELKIRQAIMHIEMDAMELQLLYDHEPNFGYCVIMPSFCIRTRKEELLLPPDTIHNLIHPICLSIGVSLLCPSFLSRVSQ